MTKEEQLKGLQEHWKKHIPFVLAIIDGREIEMRSDSRPEDAWKTMVSLDFIQGYEYRIKPVPPWRPFANAAEFMRFADRWIKCRANGELIKATRVDNSGIAAHRRDQISYVFLFKNYEFADGHPCGTFDDEHALLQD